MKFEEHSRLESQHNALLLLGLCEWALARKLIFIIFLGKLSGKLITSFLPFWSDDFEKAHGKNFKCHLEILREIVFVVVKVFVPFYGACHEMCYSTSNILL